MSVLECVFLDVDPVDNWMICHGRNVALSAVLAANLPIVFSEEREEEILKIVSSRVLVDRVNDVYFADSMRYKLLLGV